MTSFAFILGVVPLVLAKGAGAEMRVALGVAVFSGMLGVTIFGIFFTPVFYVVIRWLTERKTPPPAAPDAAGHEAAEVEAVRVGNGDGRRDHARPRPVRFVTADGARPRAAMSDKKDLPMVDAPAARPGERVRTACLVLIAVCVVGAALSAMEAVLAPLLIAFFLFFLLRPAADAVARWRVSPWVSYPLLGGGLPRRAAAARPAGAIQRRPSSRRGCPSTAHGWSPS